MLVTQRNAPLPQQAIHHTTFPDPDRLAALSAFRLIATGKSVQRLEWFEVMVGEGSVDLNFQDDLSSIHLDYSD